MSTFDLQEHWATSSVQPMRQKGFSVLYSLVLCVGGILGGLAKVRKLCLKSIFVSYRQDIIKNI